MSKLKIKTSSVNAGRSLLMARSLRLFDNQFHIAGPAAEKARRPLLLRRWRGTTRRPRLAERRCCLEATWNVDIYTFLSSMLSLPLQATPRPLPS